MKMSTLQQKPLAKLVARLAKLYHLPPEACPFLHKKRGEGALQFLVYKRYVDGSLSELSARCYQYFIVHFNMRAIICKTSK